MGFTRAKPSLEEAPKRDEETVRMDEVAPATSSTRSSSAEPAASSNEGGGAARVGSNEEGDKRKAEGEEDDSKVKKTVKYLKTLQKSEARSGSSATQEVAEVVEKETNEEDGIQWMREEGEAQLGREGGDFVTILAQDSYLKLWFQQQAWVSLVAFCPSSFVRQLFALFVSSVCTRISSLVCVSARRSR